MKKYFDLSFRDPGKFSSLNQLREQLLNAMLLASLAIGTILFAFALIPAFQKGVYVSIIVYALVYTFLVIITFFHGISYRIRRLSWLSLFFILGALNLYMNGFNVDAGLFFLTMIAMAALFGGPRGGLIALGLTCLSIAIAAFIIVPGTMRLSMALPQTDPLLWLIGGMIFFLVSIFLIVSLTTLVRGLDSNLFKATDLANDLAFANESLQKSEERFRSLIEGSSDIIGVLSVDGTIRYVSSPVERLLGYSPESLVGQNIFQFVNPENQSIAVAALSPGTPAEAIGPLLELRVRHADGSWKYLEVKGRELITNPVIQGTIINCRDITDRKEVEGRLRKSQLLLEKTFASLNDALFLIDTTTVRIVDCNAAALKIFGYSREEILGQTTNAIFRDGDAFEEFRDQDMPITEDQEHPDRFERWMRRKDGSVFPSEYSISPLIDEKDGHIGWVSIVHEITARKQIEQSLLKAKDELEQRVAERTAEVERTSKQLRELVAHSPAVIYSAFLSSDFGISFVSENVCTLTGYAAHELMHDLNFWRNLIHPDDFPVVLGQIQLIKQAGSVVFEYRVRRKDGQYRWIRDEMKLVRDSDGLPKELVGSWVDITDQKVAEQALQESEATNRVILNSTDASISLIDPSGIILSINEAGADFLRSRPKDIIGKCVYDFFPADVAKRRKERNEEVCRSGRPAHYEDFRDGYWFENSVYPILDEHGKTVRLVIHAYNITESKKTQESLLQSEERYRTLADASPDLIFIINLDDKVEYVNTYAASFLHLPLSQIIGQPRMHFFASETGDHQKESIKKVIEKGESVYAEWPHKLSDRSIWLGTWLVPMRDVLGQISGVLGVSRNITIQKQAEQEILQSRSQLEERVKERTAELVASKNQLRQLTSQLVTAQEEERRRISRELHDDAGQAIISLKYNLASILNEVPDTHYAPARQRLLDSIKISDQMMSQIRSMARSLRPPVLEIGGINLSLKVYCEEYTERTGIHISYQGDEIPNLPDDIGISLYRFVQETLTNIIKHAHATRVIISLHYKKKQITLSVSDNGKGLEKNIHSDGIGLLGMEERFDLFGGSIRLTSKKGHGVKVTAHVPWPRQDAVEE